MVDSDMYSARCVDRGLKGYRVEMARCFRRRLSPKLFQFWQRGRNIVRGK